MSTTEASAAAVTLGARLDRLPLGTFHRRLVLALAGMILFEWVETYSFAFVAPALRTQWNLSLTDIAAVAGIASLGAFAGGILGGRLADRAGRRRTMLVFVTVYCAATLLCVLAQNPWQLMAARFAAHFGTQGMAVVAIVVLTEFVPAAHRGRLQTYKVVIGSLGIPVAGWAGYLLVPQGSWGWRAVFALGLFGGVFAWLIRRWVPESPRWLVARGEFARADEIVRAIERQCGAGPAGREPTATGPGPMVSAAAGPAGSGPADPASVHPLPGPSPALAPPRLRDLLDGAHRRTFLVVSAMWATGLLTYSAFQTWTPTLLAENGLALDDTLLMSAVLATAAPLGALLSAPLIDRWDRRVTQFVLGLLSALALLLFALVQAPAAVLVLGCAVNVLFQMTVPFLQVYSAEAFPTRIRALGSGTANALSRVVNLAAPTLIAAVFTGLGYSAVFLFLAGLAVVGGVVAVTLGPRTTGLSLEATAHAEPRTPPPPRNPEHAAHD
ncbi:MFS transporter [Streptomyces sp. E-08]|uniref:MFS transporter n=1 Tax=Streptomyces sp. E-08 TaxID=3404047 RepID=UPI003CED9672